MSTATRVLHLVGSPTSEFYAELSRLYAAGCWEATVDEAWHAASLAYVSPDGSWRFPADLRPTTLAAAAPMSLARAVDHITALGPHVMVPQMFCRAGMTSYRALFDVLGVPYVGNPAAVMALGADKATTRAVVSAAGVSVPEAEVLRPGQQATLQPPVVVKPVDADNSHGVTLVRDPDGFAAALQSAWRHSDTALVERYVELGREVRCGVLERDGELVSLPLEEYAVDPDTKPVRDEADKLARSAGGELHLVAKDAEHAWLVPSDDPATEVVGAAARRCFQALGCRDYGLFDFRLDPSGHPWFLEAGLYCSYAPTSVVAVMAEAAGIALADLFATQVEAARRRAPQTPDEGALR
jgi:D-alanine-D-alanine ligase